MLGCYTLQLAERKVVTQILQGAQSTSAFAEAHCEEAVWDLQGGEIRSQWAGRTVIASASKLAYGHAQAVIDGAPPPEAPTQLHGGHSWEQVQTSFHSGGKLNSDPHRPWVAPVAPGSCLRGCTPC